MNLEQQVTNLELSKRLKELGAKQESLFWWAKCSAFTVAELGSLLPAYYESYRCDDGHWECTPPENRREDGLSWFKANTEADARAKMLCYLLENKLIQSEAV